MITHHPKSVQPDTLHKDSHNILCNGCRQSAGNTNYKHRTYEKTYRMKKLISLSAIISLVASACTTSVIDAPEEKSQAIAFGGPQAESRAAIEAGYFPTTSTFKVWGGYGDTDATVDPKNLFDGVEIIYTEESKWHYEGYPRFWVGGKTHDFYAVYPIVTSDVSEVISDVSEQGIITVTDFNSFRTGANAIDLMTAFHSRVTPEDLNQQDVAAVSFKFKHELSRVNVKVKAVNTPVTVNELKIYGISDVGTLTKNYNDNNDNSLWSLNEAITAENTPFVVSDDFVLGESEVWERNAFGDMLLIPQSLGNAKLYISYRYDGATTDRTSTINLNTATTTEWKAGTSYNYSITINGLSNISITVSVNPWEEENTSVSWE